MYSNTTPDRGSKTLPTLYTKPEMLEIIFNYPPLMQKPTRVNQNMKSCNQFVLTWILKSTGAIPSFKSSYTRNQLIWHFYLGVTHSDPCNNKLQHSHTVVMHGDRPSNQTAWRGKHTCPNSSCRRVAVWCKASNVLINEEKSEKKLALVKYKQIKKSIMKDGPDLK
jgi:hypothetical protein